MDKIKLIDFDNIENAVVVWSYGISYTLGHSKIYRLKFEHTNTVCNIIYYIITIYL